jgi:signal transduction histidine kinase
MRSASRLLIVLLAFTVALAGLLAFEAQRATRSHRVTAERALRDYATVAAWEFVGAADETLERLLGRALAPAIAAPAASPYDSLPPAAVLASADSVLRCRAAPDTGRLYFSLDLRTSLLATTAAAPDPLRRWLRDTLLAQVRGANPSGPRLVLGRGPGEGRLVAYGVKPLRYSGYAQHDAPLAIYGLVSCASTLDPVFGAVLRAHPLLPGTVAGGIPSAMLVALDVTAPDGRPLFRTGGRDSAGYAGDPARSRTGGFAVRAVIPADVAGRLVVARPGPRLPLLLSLLALTAALAGVALRQLRREQELARLRADFTSSVSHELRTPLTQILLFAETLELGRAGGEDERRQALGIIVQEARRLAHLVENVLQFSRAERRMLRVRPERVALAPLLREIVERFVPLAGASAVRIRAELDEMLVAPVHPESLHQVMLNLLDNAVKHGGGSAIVIRALRHRDAARLEVEDRGPGVPQADRERIWRPFVRLTGGTGVAGSGIGLAVVHELVLAQGGACGVEEPAGGGARFFVEFPGAERVDATLRVVTAAGEA